MNLAAWGNFYVVVGSSAGALIGLQFVVITLLANSPNRVDPATTNAFGTPTVVHFGSVMTLCAILCAPWSSIAAFSITVAVGGIGGFLYSIVVFRRAGNQSGYKPVVEDWIWFVILPGVSYAVLALAGILMLLTERVSLCVIAVVALGLLLIGIHNAWDTVIHIAVNGPGLPPKKE